LPLPFTPSAGVFEQVKCQGVSIIIEDWSKTDPLQVGYALAVTLKRLYPTTWKTRHLNELLMNDEIYQAIERGASLQELMTLNKKNLEGFLEVRQKYLLY
jgi:uncharacterized protein YbbC (DUF1343 family)